MDRLIMTSNTTKNSSTRRLNDTLNLNDGLFIVHRDEDKSFVTAAAAPSTKQGKETATTKDFLQSTEIEAVPLPKSWTNRSRRSVKEVQPVRTNNDTKKRDIGASKVLGAKSIESKALVDPSSPSPSLLPSESTCSPTMIEVQEDTLIVELEASKQREETALRQVQELESVLRSLTSEKDEIWADAMLLADDNDVLTKELKEARSESKKLKKEIKWLHEKLEDAHINITKQEQKIQEQDDVIFKSWHGGVPSNNILGDSLSNHGRQWTSLHGGDPGAYSGGGTVHGSSQKGEEPWDRMSFTSSSMCSSSLHEPHSEGAIASLKKKMNRRIRAVTEEKAEMEKKMEILVQQKGREVEIATEMARAASHRSLALQRVMKDCPSCWVKSDLFLPDQPVPTTFVATEREDHTSASKGKTGECTSASGSNDKGSHLTQNLLGSDASIDAGSHHSDDTSSVGLPWPSSIEGNEASTPPTQSLPDTIETSRIQQKAGLAARGRSEEEDQKCSTGLASSFTPLHDIEGVAYTSSIHHPNVLAKQGSGGRGLFTKGIQAKFSLSGFRRKRSSRKRNVGHQCETIVETGHQYDVGGTPSVTSSVTFPSSLVSGKSFRNKKTITRSTSNHKNSSKQSDTSNNALLMRNSWHGGSRGKKPFALSISKSERPDRNSSQTGLDSERKETSRADRKVASGSAASTSINNRRALGSNRGGGMRNTWHGKRSTGGEKIREVLFMKQSSGSSHHDADRF